MNSKAKELWDLPWSLMEVLISGKSSVDLKEIQIENRETAFSFIYHYGYVLSFSLDRRKAHSMIVEAWGFIEQSLMNKEWKRGIRPPPAVFTEDDPIRLLLWAAGHSGNLFQAWSCALLKVLHTIAHIDGAQKAINLDQARHQIMDRFRSQLFRDQSGHLRFGDQKQSVAVERVEWKNAKSRKSIILKLLHKPGNVAETIHDLLGIRIITKKLSDTLLAIKFLNSFHLISYPNILPARSKNTLIDLDNFQQQLQALFSTLDKEPLSETEIEEAIEGFTQATSISTSSNPHSAFAYRSIQLTCRQRIRYRDPKFTWISCVKEYMSDLEEESQSKRVLEGIMEIIDRHDEENSHQEVSGFFPFEVQVLDQTAQAQAEKGLASHNRYKRSQITTARRRILGEVLKQSKSQ